MNLQSIRSPFQTWLMAGLSLVTLPAWSLDIHGVGFPEQTVLENRPLVLNGTATRTVWGIKVYVVGLFLAEANHDENAILNTDRAPKRVQISMLREVSEDQFVSTIQDNIDNNFTSAEKKLFVGELEAFFSCFNGGTELKEGGLVTIDYLPGKGMVVGLNDRQFDAIPGDDFYHAILRLWIGKPLQKSIKEGLLGRVG